MSANSEIRISQIDFNSFAQEIRIIISEELQKILKKNTEKLLSPSAACKLFNPPISRGTLHRWTIDKLIPYHLLGGKKLYKEADIISASEKIKRYKQAA